MKLDLYKLILVLVILALGIMSVYTLFILFRSISWPYAFDYTDAGIISVGSLNLYKSFSTYPYVITYYTPLFYILVGSFNHIARVSSPYFYERLLSFLAVIANSILIYLITKKVTKGDRLIALLAPLLFLSSYYYLIIQWATIVGPVIFEMVFDFIAIYMIIDYKGKKSIFYAAVALVVGLLFKQSSLFAFLAVLIYLLANKKQKDAFLFASVYVAFAGVIFIALDILTGGRFLLSTFLIPLSTTFSSATLLSFFIIFMTESWMFLLIPFILYSLYKNIKSVVSISLIVVGGLSLLGTAKSGGGLNYFAEFLAFSCIAATYGTKIFAVKSNRKYLIPILVYLASLIPLVMIIAHYGPQYSYPFRIAPPSKVGIMLRNVSGPILADNPAVIIAANKSMFFDPGLFWVLKEKGLWNDSQIVSDVKAKRFGAITFPDGLDWFRYYPSILDAMNSSYHLNGTAFGWCI